MDNKNEESATLHLNEEVTQKLLELQNKKIDVNKLLLELLQKRKLELAREKEKLAAEESNKQRARREAKRSAAAQSGATKPPRYMSVKIRKHLQKEHGTKCSMPTCTKPAEHIHHTQRFALSHNHDPRYLAPLCPAIAGPR